MTDQVVPVCEEEFVEPTSRLCSEPVVGLTWRERRQQWRLACVRHGGNTLPLGAERLVQLGAGRSMRQVLDAQELHYCGLIGPVPE